MAYTSKNVVKDGASITVGASETATPVTGTGAQDAFAIHLPFKDAICIDLVCSDVTSTTGITAKLQTRYSNEQTWVDSKTAAITANGTTSIRLVSQVADDQAHLPLRSQGRVVITTGTDDTVTVDAVYVPSAY